MSTRTTFRFKVKFFEKTGHWFLHNEWTGEMVDGYCTSYAAKKARLRLEEGETFYDEGDLDKFIEAERALGHQVR